MRVPFFLKQLLCTTFILAFLGHSFCQPVNLQFRQITVDNGLSSASVMIVYQDHNGFMWIGTNDGLNRYDGRDFVVFKNDPADSNSIANDMVRAIIEDRNQNLLIGTSYGLSIFDRNAGNFKNYILDKSSPLFGINCTVHKIIEDSLGNLWLATNVALMYFDRINNKVVQYKHNPKDENSLSNSYVEYIFNDSEDRLWVTTVRGINLFQPETKNFKRIYKGIKEGDDYSNILFIGIVEDKKRNIWFGSEDGLFCYTHNSNNYVLKRYVNDPDDSKSLSNNRVRVLYVDDSNHLWLGTENGGVNLYNNQNDKFWRFRNDKSNFKSLSHESVWSIFQDNIGNYWIGTYGGGINISLKQSDAIIHYKSLITESGGLSHNVITSLCEDVNKNIWIGTDGGGLNLYNRETKKFITYNTTNSGLRSNAILDIIRDSKDRIWMGTWDGGLVFLDYKTKKIQSITTRNSNIPDNNIYTIAEGDNDDLWMGSYENGLIHYSIKENKFENFTRSNSQIANNYIFVIKKDMKGRLYLGLTNGLQIYYPKENKYVHYPYNPDNPNGISNAYIFDIYIENDSSVWIGTQNGLNQFNPNTGIFTKYFKKDGLPNSVIKGIIPDNNGMLWLSTNFGVCQFDYRHNKFRNYTKEDGLQSNEFYFNSINKTDDGAILMGGINGFNIIFPDKIYFNKNIPNILITDFEIFNKHIIPGIEGSELEKDISETEKITLSYDQSVLTFYFAVMDFTVPEKNQYAFKMEGFDKDWIYSGNRRNTTYTNLDPGEYTFKVKGSNNDGVWNEEGTSLKIIILPPWWQTWWFRLLFLLLIVSVIIGFVYYRMANIRNLNIKLRKLVDERTIEIEMKNRSLIEQSEILNETNTLLEERQQKVEEQAEELMTQKEDLVRINDELKSLNATKDKFFTIIAHDLKNPFNAILGFGELLSVKYDSYDDAKKRSLINVIYESSKNIYRLLENLLHWSRSQTGSIEFKPEEFYISELIESNKVLFENLLKEKNLQLNIINKENLKVFADRNMINMVVRNLIANAMKFTENGAISIECEQDNSHVVVKIKDTGVGISQEKIAVLFDIGSSKSTHGTRGESGTGLGLILCKEFITKNKGSIGAESEEGKGSTFYFTLHVKPD